MRRVFDWPLKSLLVLALVGAVPGLTAAQEQEASGDQAATKDNQAASKDNQDRNDQEQKEQEQQKEQARTVKAFDLEHVQPQEMLTVIQTISARQHQAKLNREANEKPQGQRGVAQQQQRRTQVGFRPTGAQQDRLAVATDEQSKTLFVRGTEDQVSTVEKLVEMFDTDAGNLEKQELDGVTLVPVPQGQLQRINTILSQLQLQTQNLRVGETALLILPDDEDQAKQVEQVIEKLKESNDSGQQDKQAGSEN